jgi:general secretion pathway protein A
MYDKHFGFTEPPFSVTPDPRFLYNSQLYQEAFAVLRYGIEARKGFIVITGEAGTGKTTLLRMLMHSLSSNVHTAFIFNPRLRFTELLRTMLNDLGITVAADDRLTMMGRLNDYLIEQVKGGEVVAVLIDEAQDLSDEMLEELRLLSNLETDKEKLLQIVLMGQPELEWKLDRPELRQLKQRVAMRGRLLPLSRHDVGLYIASRLKTAGYGGKELFAPGVVDKIARYSRGIPRIINVICDNALLTAYAASSKQVSAAMIEEVARDLRLAESAAVVKETPAATGATPTTQSEARSRAQEENTMPAEVAGFRAMGGAISPRATRLAVGGVACFVILIGIGVVFYSQQSRGALAGFIAKIGDLIVARADRLAQVEPTAAASKRRNSAANRVQTLAAQNISPSIREPKRDVTVPETSNPGDSQAAQAPERSGAKSSPENAARAPDKFETAAKEPSEEASRPTSTGEKLETKVYRAISNRAIRGVAVSVVDGTVYLAGQVATERQKAAAAQAARNVPGVKEVHDQITVDSGVGPAVPG